MKIIHDKTVSLGGFFIDKISHFKGAWVLPTIAVIIVVSISLFSLPKNVSLFILGVVLVCTGVVIYVLRQQPDDAKWKATVAWILLIVVTLVTAGILVNVAIFSSNPWFLSLGIPLVLGFVVGIGILGFVPSKGVLAWFGFLSGVSADSLTTPGIVKWLTETAKIAVDGTINPSLPASVQLSLEHINLGVWLFIGVLMFLSVPAFTYEKS